MSKRSETSLSSTPLFKDTVSCVEFLFIREKVPTFWTASIYCSMRKSGHTISLLPLSWGCPAFFWSTDRCGFFHTLSMFKSRILIDPGHFTKTCLSCFWNWFSHEKNNRFFVCFECWALKIWQSKLKRLVFSLVEKSLEDPWPQNENCCVHEVNFMLVIKKNLFWLLCS